MIKKYKINGKIVCVCDKNGLPQKDRREKPRMNIFGEQNVENQYRTMMKMSSFSVHDSISNKWLCGIFGRTKAKYIEAKSMAIFFGAIMEDIPTREVYRRLSTLLYWFDQKIEKISDICMKYEIKVQISKRVVKIPPPSVDMHKIMPKEEEIKLEWFPAEFEDFFMNLFDTTLNFD